MSHPNPTISVPQTARSESVYVPVTRPKDRPIIPPGGLAPAPLGTKKAGSAGLGIRAMQNEQNGGGTGQEIRSNATRPEPTSGGGGGKWADRLRAKR